MYNMNISEMGGYAAYRKVYQNFDNLNQDNKNYENTRSADADMGAVSQRDRISKRDTVEISAAGKSAFTESLNADLDLPEASNENADADFTENQNADADFTDDAENESESVGGAVGINAAKLARKLAAAKTRDQVRAVMAEIQSDLKECESGKARGMDVDEASVQAAERLLQEARRRMGETEDRKATPEEEMASNLADLL